MYKQIIFSKVFVAATLVLAIVSCQKIERPENASDFPVDTNPPGGPLKFYAAFDGTSTDPLRNAVDSIRANFPADNPFTSVSGISGKAMQGAPKKFIKYPSFNDWTSSSSFSVSVWFKKNGQTLNNVGGNGPEHIFSLRAKKKDDNTDYHWSNSVMLFFLEGNNAGCAVKTMCVSPSNPSNPNSNAKDNWFTWEGGQTIPGILDNNWHHLVITYDEGTSTMKLFVDGVQNSNVRTWTGQGPIRLSASMIGEHRVGRGPRNDDEGDGESGWLQSSFKGSIDQLRFYSKELTAAEVTALFTGKK
jgi:hypothetical protein